MNSNQTSRGEPSSSKYVPTERSSLTSNKKEKYPALDQQPQPETYGTIEEPISITEPNLHDTYRNKKLCTYIILFITIITTLIIFVLLWIAPTFAERTIKEGVQFKFQTASILNVSKENTMSMHVVGQIRLEPTLYSWSKQFSKLFGQVNINPSELSVMHADQTIGIIGLPALSLNASSAFTEFDFVTRFIIQDSHAFMSFCMNGLKETKMQSMSFPGANPLGGVSISGTVGLFNPSDVLSLRLGDVDFGIYLPGTQGDSQIAIVRAIDANLQGNRMNYFNVTGRTLPFTSDAEGPMSSFLTRYLHGESSIVHVRGSSFGPDPNQPTNTPSWLQDALGAITIAVPFPGATETDLIQDLDLSHIKIDFSPSGHPLISADVVTYLKQPNEFNFDLDITEIDPVVYLYLNYDSLHAFAIVQSDSPCPAQTTKSGDHQLTVKSKIVKAPFQVLPGGQKDFEEFLNRVFYEKKGKVYIRGTSDAQVDSAFGHIAVHDLEFNGVIEIQGMQGLGHPEVTSVSIVRGYQDALEISTTLKIYNPSNAAVNLGDLHMALLYDDHVIGNASIPSLALDAGVDNHLKVSAWLQGNDPYVIDFIGEYISTGIAKLSNVNLTISGNYPNATSSEFLRPLIHNLTLSVPVPPFDKEPLLADCQMNLLSSTVVMSLRNPFPGIVMTINNINASATYDIYEIGNMAANFEDPGEGWKEGPMILPGPICDVQCKGIVIKSEKIPVITKKLGYDAIKRALGGSIVVSVESQVGVMLGNFNLENLRYVQNNITTKVRKGF
ncbi:hypothetical protein G6F46_010383 [Rhizopus delemar]|nr:hypothetical protein G6F54_010288 [Rhizopus delemar]KAG1549570.1 hypothetical protein G6F51_002984 [Rhizopus arrhizus]KAG1505870.1 hypothetical protein G6F53_010098 [Rhizopus delemar]KAG1520004.1 hypothetical protein G6F52_008078 [Rhizopus delemar]KAG1555246.1 hypothetical protein G6F49_007327 [Rhizopus delemar]